MYEALSYESLPRHSDAPAVVGFSCFRMKFLHIYIYVYAYIHTSIRIHTYIYIYYIRVCVCVYKDTHGLCSDVLT